MVREECRYMDTVNDVNKNHCLFINPLKQQSSSPWQRICNDKDENCIGVDECNQFECTVPKLGGGTEVAHYREKFWNEARKSKVEASKEIPTEPPNPLPMEYM